MRRTLHIEYSWWRVDGQPIDSEDEETLDEDALDHLQEMMSNGYVAGELDATTTAIDDVDIHFRGWWKSSFNAVEDDGVRPALRCTWCCKDTPTNPCIHCMTDTSVTDRSKPHRPEWSRATAQEVECKVCDRRGPYSIQQSSDWCDSSNNDQIHGLHEG